MTADLKPLIWNKHNERNMIYTELHNEEDILKVINEHWHSDDNTLLPPMFHGTDFSLMNIANEERDLINGACELIIRTIHKKFRERGIGITDKKLMAIRDSYGDAANAYIKAGGRVNNNSLYSYGDFYVTNNPQRAEGYSREAWILGETGQVANLLVEGARALNIELPTDESFVDAYNVFCNRRNGIKDPVIIVVTDCRFSELYYENGKQINYESEIKTLKKDNKSICCSYRLGKETLENDASYYVVRKKLFSNLIRIYYEFND